MWKKIDKNVKVVLLLVKEITQLVHDISFFTNNAFSSEQKKYKIFVNRWNLFHGTPTL